MLTPKLLNPKAFKKPGAGVDDTKPKLGAGVENPRELLSTIEAGVENSEMGAAVEDSTALKPKLGVPAELISTPRGDGVEYPAELTSTIGDGVEDTTSSFTPKLGAGVVYWKTELNNGAGVDAPNADRKSLKSWIGRRKLGDGDVGEKR